MSQVHTAAAQISLRGSATNSPWAVSIGGVDRVADGEGASVPNDRDFVAMLGAYRQTGDIARGEDLARLMAYLQRGDYISLARQIVAGEASQLGLPSPMPG